MLKDFLNKIFHVFVPKKYEITKETGMFKYIVVGNTERARAGQTVTVERVSMLPEDMSNPFIKVVDDNKNVVDVKMTRFSLRWEFEMPEANVKIVPTVKRKFGKND